jgi:hypothetical protein
VNRATGPGPDDWASWRLGSGFDARTKASGTGGHGEAEGIDDGKGTAAAVGVGDLSAAVCSWQAALVFTAARHGARGVAVADAECGRGRRPGEEWRAFALRLMSKG